VSWDSNPVTADKELNIFSCIGTRQSLICIVVATLDPSCAISQTKVEYLKTRYFSFLLNGIIK
jgi:hypothetical protein